MYFIPLLLPRAYYIFGVSGTVISFIVIIELLLQFTATHPLPLFNSKFFQAVIGYRHSTKHERSRKGPCSHPLSHKDTVTFRCSTESKHIKPESYPNHKFKVDINKQVRTEPHSHPFSYKDVVTFRCSKGPRHIEAKPYLNCTVGSRCSTKPECSKTTKPCPGTQRQAINYRNSAALKQVNSETELHKFRASGKHGYTNEAKPRAQGIRQELDNSGAKFKGIQRMPSSFKYSTKNLFNALQNNKKYRSHNRQNANGRLTRKYCWKYPAEHDGRTQRGKKESQGRQRELCRGNRTVARNYGADVGCQNDLQQEKSLAKISELGKGKEATSNSEHGSALCHGNWSGTAGTLDLCKKPLSINGENGNGQWTAPKSGCSTESIRCSNSSGAGLAYNACRPDKLGKSAEQADLPGNVGLLEDSIKVGRDCCFIKESVHSTKAVRNNNRLVSHTQGKESKSILAQQVDSHQWKTYRSDRDSGKTNGRLRTTPPVGYFKTGEGIPEGQHHEEIHRPFDKARCHQLSVRGARNKTTTVRNQRNPDKQISKACRDFTDIEHNPQVWGKSYCDGQGTENSGCHSFLMRSDIGRSDEREVIRKMSTQFTHRSKSTRLPVTPDEHAAPLHVSKTEPMDVPFLLKRMLPKVKQRFQHVWSLTFPSPISTTDSAISIERGFQSKFSSKHASELVQCGVAVPFKSVPISHNVPFTVYEERETGNRQRFILWTKAQNNKLTSDIYVPYVPLKHVSHYLGAVHSEVASCRDFKTGFYQISIPVESRPFFAFYDSSGKSFALTRLPMGHVCAPELMNTIAAVVAGDPLFVLEQHAERDVSIHWWIDNIRLFGPRQAVQAATSRMDDLARRAGVTWKPSDSIDCSTCYEFLGVLFSHKKKTVGLGTKIKRKLRSTCLSSLTASQLESLGGRLLHASTVSGVSPGRYWFALKYLRRITNYLNRGVFRVQDVLKIPHSVEKELISWISSVQIEREIIPKEKKGKTADVFVDASLQGWGGVVVWDTGELVIVGSSWPPGESRHINVLEADALGQTLNGISEADHLSIWVDNTTVCGAFRKKMCVRSHAINECLMSAVNSLSSLKCSYNLEWVSTKYNPADVPSREPISSSTRSKVEQALGAFFNSRRGVGAGVPSGPGTTPAR